MNITRKDISWNFVATFLKIGSSALLLPIILKLMPSEMVGIWSIFITITAFATLLDFGFSPSFTRNVTYIFSGVSELNINGVAKKNQNKSIDYGLLKGLINAMKWFYLRISIILFLLLSTFGTFYIYFILKEYSGDHITVYIAWGLLCLITTYNIYTYYYDSLLMGKGMIIGSKKITIFGQILYLSVAYLMLYLGFGLIAIIVSQIFSTILIRFLSKHLFFTKELKLSLSKAKETNSKDLIKIIYPNALKIGLTTLGGVISQRSTIIIGSLYLSLNEIASFSITSQLIAILATASRIFITTYQPKFAQLQVENNFGFIKELYLKGVFYFITVFVSGAFILIIFGQFSLDLLQSQTKLLSNSMIWILLLIVFLENNFFIAISIILSRNQAPFYKSLMMTGLLTIIFLYVLLSFTDLGLWSLIIAPGFAYLYNYFKWPIELIHQLDITIKDIKNTLFRMVKFKV